MGNSPANSLKDLTIDERASRSLRFQLGDKMDRDDKATSGHSQATSQDKACNPPTLFTVANSDKTIVFILRSLKDARPKGSHGDLVRDKSTTNKSQEG